MNENKADDKSGSSFSGIHCFEEGQKSFGNTRMDNNDLKKLY